MSEQYTYNSILTVCFMITNIIVVLYYRIAVLNSGIEIVTDEMILYLKYASKSEKDGPGRE